MERQITIRYTVDLPDSIEVCGERLNIKVYDDGEHEGRCYSGNVKGREVCLVVYTDGNIIADVDYDTVCCSFITSQDTSAIGECTDAIKRYVEEE